LSAEVISTGHEQWSEERSPDRDDLWTGLPPALEQINVPVYIIERDGRIRWLNDAARKLFGNVIGKEFTAVVAPEHALRARQQFTRKLFGAEKTDFDVNLLLPDGSRLPVQVSSVPLEDGGKIVGVFGIVRGVVPQERKQPLPPGVQLTPRQAEVLALLDRGLSTEQIAEELCISVETVRNHVREVLRRLQVNSRIGALAAGRRHGLI
jgi:PAS domain S-box-containing protein